MQAWSLGVVWPAWAWPGLASLGLVWWVWPDLPGLAWPGQSWPGLLGLAWLAWPAWPGLSGPGLAWLGWPCLAKEQGSDGTELRSPWPFKVTIIRNSVIKNHTFHPCLKI